MLCNVHSRSAVFTTERESLQYPYDQKNCRRRHSNRRIGRKDTDQRRRPAHHQKCDEEGVFAAGEVSKASKEKSAERPHDEADRKRGKISDQRKRVVASGIKEWRYDCGETPEA